MGVPDGKASQDSRADGAARRGPPRLLTRLVTRLALVLLPLALLVVLVEGALWALGQGDPTQVPPLGRGFDVDAAYLVPDPVTPGGWLTQVFGDERDVRIPPRDARRRVLLFGGSNTMLLPGRVLQDALHERAPGGPGWEVLNLGRAGYGSARVTILLEQALARVSPDVVVVYSGHNEFVEAGFRFEIDDALSRQGVLRLIELLANLRLFRVIERGLRSAAVPPADIDPAKNAYGRITWDGTLQVFDAYAGNLRRMADACARAGVPLILGTVVGNDWRLPRISELPATLDGDAAWQLETWIDEAAAALPERFQLWDADGEPLRLRVGRWFNGQLGPHDPGPMTPHGGPLADPPAWSRADPLADSVAGALWPDPARWSADVRTVVERYRRFMAPVALSEEERARLLQARDELAVVLARAPDHALALYVDGQIAWLLGDRDGGAARLRRASARDCAPRRGNDSTNALVRAVAAEREGVTLFDAAERFASWSPHGVVGYSIMMDGCHLQPGARRVLLDELAPLLIDVLAD